MIIQNTKWDDDGKPILTIESMLDFLANETKEVWIMEPVPKETEDLAQPDKQKDTKAGHSKFMAAGGTQPQTQPSASIARKFTLPYNKWIGTWGLKIQDAEGDYELNPPCWINHPNFQLLHHHLYRGDLNLPDGSIHPTSKQGNV